MKKFKKFTLFFSISVIFIAIIGGAFLLTNNGENRIVLNFVLGDALSSVGGVGSDYDVIIQVEAIDPIGEPPSVTIIHGRLNDSKLVIDPAKNNKFRQVLEKWSDRLSNYLEKEYVKTALKVSIWIVGESKHYRVVPDKVINFSPIAVLRGKGLVEDVVVHEEELREIENATSYLSNKLTHDYGLKDGGYWVDYVWELYDYYSPSNYIEIPVMILDNPEYDSGYILGAINILSSYETTFSYTISLGFEVYDKAENNEYDLIELDVYKGGVSYATHKYFYRSTYVLGWEQRYIYIMGKPVYAFYKEKRVVYIGGVPAYSTYTGEEKIEHYVRDVKTDGYYFVGGSKDGLPDIMDWFFDGSHTEHLYISRTPISDGDLDVNEAIALESITNYFDVNQVGFGIGLPIGALLAPFTGPLAPVVSAIGVSVEYSQYASIRISGGYQNYGEHLGYGFDIPEEFWVAVSNYVYSSSLGDFEVPVGIYTLFKSYSTGGGCPILYVFDGSSFVEEGYLDIHNLNGTDVVINHELASFPAMIEGNFVFRLVEDYRTFSYIDSVKLFALLDNGSIVSLPLIYAHHSVFGDVLYKLLDSDDLYVVSLGSRYSSHGNHVIDLEFKGIELDNVVGFIFQIEGRNLPTK